MEWYQILLSVLSGLITVIPLVIKLIEYVEKAAREKNWHDLLELITNLMQEAESKFNSGLERREWVLMMVKASADTINYDIDLDKVGELIDSLCAMTKTINANKTETVVEKIEE